MATSKLTREILEKSVKSLENEHRTVIELYYGFNRDKRMSLRLIADTTRNRATGTMGVSRTAITQALCRARGALHYKISFLPGFLRISESTVTSALNRYAKKKRQKTAWEIK